jgi:hypothetical protein
MKKNNLKQIGFVTLSLLSMNLNGGPVTHTTAATATAGAHKAAHGEETVEARETKAMRFFMKLLECPLEKVPAWKDFVNEIARLLEGSTTYAALRESLLKVRDKTGPFGKLAIATELKKHGDCLPKEIIDKLASLGKDELSKRVKN